MREHWRISYNAIAFKFCNTRTEDAEASRTKYSAPDTVLAKKKLVQLDVLADNSQLKSKKTHLHMEN